MSDLMYVNLAIAALNTLLALGLGWVYWRNHREFRSNFTLGLLLFALFFVVHNGMVAYHYLVLMTAFGGVNESWLLLEGVLQALGMGALLWSTTQ